MPDPQDTTNYDLQPQQPLLPQMQAQEGQAVPNSEQPQPPAPAPTFDDLIKTAKAKKEASDQQINELLKQLNNTNPQQQLQDWAKQNQSALNQARLDRDADVNKQYGTAGRFIIDLLRAPGQKSTSEVAQGKATADWDDAMKKAQEAIINDRNNKQEQIKLLQSQSQANAPLAKIAEQQDIEQKRIQQNVDMLKQMGVWDKMSAREQASFMGGKNISPEQTGRLLSSGTTAEKAEGLLGVPKGSLPTDTLYRITSGPDGKPQAVPTEGKINTAYIVGQDGKIQQTNTNATGAQIGQTQQPGGLTVPALLPSQDTTQKTMTVQTPNGPQQVLMPVTSTKQKVIPGQIQGNNGTSGSPSPNNGLPPGAINLGPKPLTPNEQLTANNKLGALNNTYDIVNRIKDNPARFGDLLSAGKVQMQVDPKTGYIHGAINRNVPLTKDEQQLASDMISVAEHINTLRGPLGATGFRGADAFANLLSQGGSLKVNPDVMTGVLNNTLKALKTQQDNLKTATGKQTETSNSSAETKVQKWTKDKNGNPIMVKDSQ